jgi:hypothetical protein
VGLDLGIEQVVVDQGGPPRPLLLCSCLFLVAAVGCPCSCYALVAISTTPCVSGLTCESGVVCVFTCVSCFLVSEGS